MIYLEKKFEYIVQKSGRALDIETPAHEVVMGV